MRSVLIIGASGQLGRALCAAFEGAGELVGTGWRAPLAGQERLDLADPEATRALLRRVSPEWILLAGAYCNVDQAEAEPDRCLAVNARGPETVAAYARERGSRVVYFSTDSVFDGSAPAHAEDDTPRPVNVYSMSKAAGEQAIAALPESQRVILRTAWVYGPDEAHRNFALRVVHEARAGRSIQVPEDQWGTPTYSDDVAQLARWMLDEGRAGVWHAPGPECISRVAMARAICERFGLEPQLVRPVPTAALGQRARRPLRVRLDGAKLRAAYPRPFRSLEEGLASLRSWYERTQSVTAEEGR